MSDLTPCACGRPFVPLPDYYAAHVQTAEHSRWSGSVRGEYVGPARTERWMFRIILGPLPCRGCGMAIAWDGRSWRTDKGGRCGCVGVA